MLQRMKLFVLIVLCCVCAQAQTWSDKVIAAVLVGEAGNQGERGLRAVAEVIRERSQQSGQTPLQVVRVRRAFSCFNGTTAEALVRKHSRSRSYPVALSIAKQISSDPAGLGNQTKGATHFTRKDENPFWARGHKPVVVIGDHAFYRLQ